MGDISGRKLNIGINGLGSLNTELTQTAGSAAKLGNTIQSFGKWVGVASAVTVVRRSLREALTTMREVDSELASIQKTSGATDAEMQRLAKSAYSVASAYGVAASEYLKNVAAFTKAGFQNAEAAAELAVKTQLVGDTTAEVANKFLIAVDAAYKLGGNIEALSGILDRANKIENTQAVSLSQIAEAIPRVASVAAQAGVSIDELMGSIGTVIATTQLSASTVGTALRSIYLNVLKDTSTAIEGDITLTEGQLTSFDEVLTKYAGDALKAAKATGEIINPMEALGALADAYRDGLLSDLDMQRLEYALAGKLRVNQLEALLSEWDGTYSEIMNDIQDAAGSADAEISVMLGTWESKTNIFKNTWTEFVSKTINTDFIKGLVDAGTAVVDFGDNLGAVAVIAGTMAYTVKNGADALLDIRTAADISGLGLKTWSTAASVAVTAITLVALAVKQHKENLREAAAESLKAAEAESESAAATLKAYTAFRDAERGTKDFDAAAKALAKTLGTELSPNVETTIEKLNRMTSSALEAAAVAANVAVDDAQKALVANRDGAFVTGLGAVSPALENTVSGLLDGYGDNLGYYSAGKSAEEVRAFYEQLEKAKEAIESYARSAKDNSVLESSAYKSIVESLGKMSEAYSTYVSAVRQANEAEARIVLQDFVKEVGTDAPDALVRLANQLMANKEYSKEFRAVVMELAREILPEMDFGFQKAETSADRFSKALKKLSDETNLMDDAIGDVLDALNSFGAGSYEVYEAMLALEVAIPESTKQLYDFETGAWLVDTALISDKASLFDLVEASSRVDLDNAISELENLQAAALESMAAVGITASYLNQMGYGLPYQNLLDSYKKELGELTAHYDLLRSRSSYQPKETRDTSATSRTSSSEEADKELESRKHTVSLLKSELEIMEKQGASEADRIAKMKAIQNALHEEAEYLRSIGADQVEINSLSSEWLDYQDKIRKITEETLETQKELFDSLRETVDNYYDKVVSDKEKELDLEEKILAVQEAQAALAKAESERNVRYFNAEKGQWEWAANAKNVKSAQDALDKAKQALTEYNTTQAQAEFKSAWDYVADQIKSGAMTFREAYDYMYQAMLGIQDKYGVDLGLTLEDSIGGFKDLNFGIDGLTKEVADTLGASVGILHEKLKVFNDAVGDFKTAWEEAAEKLKSGEFTFDDAFSYLKKKAQTIADKYGIDMTDALDEAIQGFDKTSGSIDDLWKQVVITLMRANSVNWWSADEAGKAYLHAQNEVLGKTIGATYDSKSGYWYDSNGYRLYDPNDGNPNGGASSGGGSTSGSGGGGTSGGGGSGSVSGGGGSGGTYNAQAVANANYTKTGETVEIGGQTYDTGMFSGNGFYWKNGQVISTKTDAPVSSAEVAEIIAIANRNGVDLSVAASMYSANKYQGAKYDKGGVLRGMGGIKATEEDELILPPDITDYLLSPLSDTFVRGRLDLMRDVLANKPSATAISRTSIGSQHNGNIYQLGGISLSEAQARNMTVMDLANLAKKLGISNSKN